MCVACVLSLIRLWPINAENPQPILLIKKIAQIFVITFARRLMHGRAKTGRKLKRRELNLKSSLENEP